MTNDHFSGMTVTERLYACGMMADFDQAAKIRNRDKIIEILLEVGLTEDQATQAAEATMSDPARYGY